MHLGRQGCATTRGLRVTKCTYGRRTVGRGRRHRCLAAAPDVVAGEPVLRLGFTYLYRERNQG
jgi:hypothetical protein